MQLSQSLKVPGGSSLADYANLTKVSGKLGKNSLKIYKRLSKTGLKKGGKVAARLTRKQLNKLASKIAYKPLSKILTQAAAHLTVAAGGAGATVGTASTGVGIPVSVILAICTILYIVWSVLSILDTANDLLRLIAQVHIEDQKFADNDNDEMKSDPEIDKMIESGEILLV